jgi:hypothetical protein
MTKKVHIQGVQRLGTRVRGARRQQPDHRFFYTILDALGNGAQSHQGFQIQMGQNTLHEKVLGKTWTTRRCYNRRRLEALAGWFVRVVVHGWMYSVLRFVSNAEDTMRSGRVVVALLACWCVLVALLRRDEVFTAQSQRVMTGLDL